MNRLSMPCGILDISQPCRPSQPAMEIVFFYVVFIAYNVFIFVCVALCVMFSLSVVCHFVPHVYSCVLCLIVASLSQGADPFAVQLNNNNNDLFCKAIFPVSQPPTLQLAPVYSGITWSGRCGEEKIFSLSRETSHLLYRLSCSARTRNIHNC
jgi:hypothetical protein